LFLKLQFNRTHYEINPTKEAVTRQQEREANSRAQRHIESGVPAATAA